MLDWFTDYLDNLYQRVAIQGQSSSWGKINTGVPQGPVLGPLLFLIYINDIVDLVLTQGKRKLFADGTTLYLDVDNPTIAAEKINCDLSSLQ